MWEADTDVVFANACLVKAGWKLLALKGSFILNCSYTAYGQNCASFDFINQNELILICKKPYMNLVLQLDGLDYCNQFKLSYIDTFSVMCPLSRGCTCDCVIFRTATFSSS